MSRALHIIQSGLEMLGPETVLLKCDIKNAFNERKREQLLADLFKEKRLRPLWRFAHWAYQTPSTSRVDHGTFVGALLSEQGVRQGDGLASLLLSLSVQKLRVVKVADDFILLGPPQEVLATFRAFLNEIKGSGLEVRATKCGFYGLTLARSLSLSAAFQLRRRFQCIRKPWRLWVPSWG